MEYSEYNRRQKEEEEAGWRSLGLDTPYFPYDYPHESPIPPDIPYDRKNDLFDEQGRRVLRKFDPVGFSYWYTFEWTHLSPELRAFRPQGGSPVQTVDRDAAFAIEYATTGQSLLTEYGKEQQRRWEERQKREETRKREIEQDARNPVAASDPIVWKPLGEDYPIGDAEKIEQGRASVMYGSARHAEVS